MNLTTQQQAIADEVIGQFSYLNDTISSLQSQVSAAPTAQTVLDLQTQIGQLNGTISGLQAQVDPVLIQQNQSLNAQVLQLTSDKSTLQTSLDSANAIIATLQAEIAKVKADLV